MLLEPEKPKSKWSKILGYHLILYLLLVVVIILADIYFYNNGDTVIVFSAVGVLSVVSLLINKLYGRGKVLIHTLLLAPLTWFMIFLFVANTVVTQ